MVAPLNTPPTAVTSEKDFGEGPGGTYNRWAAEIALSQKEMKSWSKRAKKVVERYRDEQDALKGSLDEYESQGLNLLWSTVQTQVPAVYQFPPSPEVSRRFNSKDRAARCASMILERYMGVDLERDDAGAEWMSVLLDRLTVGRGQIWVEYDPVIRDMPTPTPVVLTAEGHALHDGTPYTGEQPQQDPSTGALMGQQPMPQIVDCRAPVKYLYWDDFLHSTARRWNEVKWVGRRRFFTRDECVEKFAAGMEQFGWAADDIPLNAKAEMDEGHEDDEHIFKRAEVWEIWDDKDVTMLVIGMSVPIQQKPRSLKLPTGKWPCPRPFYATTTNDTLRPLPDYCQWQDLAEEVDELTTRIKYLTQACKVKGARPSSLPELDTLLNGADENDLVAVDNWAAFADKGGLAGAISWLPIEQIVKVLTELGNQRQSRIEQIYQINGIGDVLRGQGDPRSTATQDRIKASYGSLRLTQMQQDFAAFIEGALQIKAEIIAEKAPADVLVRVSGIETAEQTPEAIQGGLELLKSDTIREYRISIDEQSMVAMRDEADKKSRLEFAQALGGIVEKMMQASTQGPQVLDILGETAMFAARSYRAGRELEGKLEEFIDATTKQAAAARQAAAQNPLPPPPEVQAAQIKQQGAIELVRAKQAGDMQLVDAKTASDRDREQAQGMSEMAIEQSRTAAAKETDQFKAMLDKAQAEWEAQLDMKVALAVARINADAKVQAAALAPKPEPSFPM